MAAFPGARSWELPGTNSAQRLILRNFVLVRVHTNMYTQESTLQDIGTVPDLHAQCPLTTHQLRTTGLESQFCTLKVTD